MIKYASSWGGEHSRKTHRSIGVVNNVVEKHDLPQTKINVKFADRDPVATSTVVVVVVVPGI